MREGLYVSNQTRQRRYRKERDEEEKNGEVVQMRLYNQLAEDAGNDISATNLAMLASRIGQKISADAHENVATATEESPASGFAKLVSAIQSGKLNEFIQSVIRIPNLQGQQLAAQVALKNPEVREEINYQIGKMVEVGKVEKPKVIADKLIQGVINSKLFQKMARETGSAEVSESGSEAGDAVKEVMDAVNPDLLAEWKKGLSKEEFTATPSEAETAETSASTLSMPEEDLKKKKFTLTDINKMTKPDYIFIATEFYNSASSETKKQVENLFTETQKKSFSEFTKDTLKPLVKDYLSRKNRILESTRKSKILS